jgi:hypothetical protein
MKGEAAMASIEHQLEVLHSFLAQWPCPIAIRVSDHIRHEAGAGNVAAQRLMQSELFANAAGSEREGPVVGQSVPAKVDLARD